MQTTKSNISGLPIKTYFLGTVVLTTCLAVLNLTTTAAISYVSFAVICFFTLTFLYKNAFLEAPAMIMLASVFLSYYLRPFVLYADPGLFMYRNKANVSSAEIDNTLIEVLYSCILYMIGFVLVTKPFDRKASYINPKSNDYLLKYQDVILGLMAGLVILKALLIFGLGIGIKGEKVTSPVAFLARLIPVDLIYAIVTLYLFKYSKYLSIVTKLALAVLILIFSVSILATGSKSFIMVLAFAYGTFLMYQDTRIPLRRFLFLFGVGSVAIVFSFVAATAVKVANTLGKDTSFIFQMGLELAGQLSLIEIFNDITSRFVGLDGTLICQKAMSWNSDALDHLRACFNLPETFKRAIGMTIPGIKLHNTLGTGVAVGRYIHDLPAEDAFAGAIGSIGSFKFMCAPAWVSIAKILFGAVFGGYISLLRNIRNNDLQYILVFFISFVMLFAVMSGNYDLLIALMIIKLALLGIYIFAVHFVIAIRNAVMYKSATAVSNKT